MTTTTHPECPALLAGVVAGNGDVAPMNAYSDWIRDRGDDVDAEAWRWLAAKRRWPTKQGWYIFRDEEECHLPKELIPDRWDEDVYELSGVWECLLDDTDKGYLLLFVRRWRAWPEDVRAKLWEWEPTKGGGG